MHDIHLKTPLISPSVLFLHHLFSSEFFYFFSILWHLKTQELWNDVRQEKPLLKSLSVTGSFHSASYSSFTPVFSLSLGCLSIWTLFFPSVWLIVALSPVFLFGCSDLDRDFWNNNDSSSVQQRWSSYPPKEFILNMSPYTPYGDPRLTPKWVLVTAGKGPLLSVQGCTERGSPFNPLYSGLPFQRSSLAYRDLSVSHETYQVSQNNVRGHISPQNQKEKILETYVCMKKIQKCFYDYSNVLHYFYDTFKILVTIIQKY